MPEKEVRLIDARKITNDIALYLAENSYLNSTALDALTMVFRWVREAPNIDPESLRPQWISVKKHLPRLDKAVIVATECGSVFEALRMRKDRKQYWTNAVWAYQPIENMTGKITHWMPLPEPPEESKDPFYNEANQHRLNKTIATYENGEE